MLVAFWSPFSGAGATSACVLATALATAVDKRITCSLMQVGYKDNCLFKYFMPTADERTRLSIFENTGVDALLRHSIDKVAKVEDVQDCSFSFVEKRLNVFTPSTIGTEGLYCDDLQKSVKNMFKALCGAYRLNYVDVPAGVNFYSSLALPLADLIVVCLPQNKWQIREYTEQFSFVSKKVVTVLGDYDAKCSVGPMNLALENKAIAFGKTGVIPHNTEFMESLNASSAISFYLKNCKCTRVDGNFNFIVQTRKVVEKILTGSSTDRGNWG